MEKPIPPKIYIIPIFYHRLKRLFRGSWGTHLWKNLRVILKKFFQVRSCHFHFFCIFIHIFRVRVKFFCGFPQFSLRIVALSFKLGEWGFKGGGGRCPWPMCSKISSFLKKWAKFRLTCQLCAWKNSEPFLCMCSPYSIYFHISRRADWCIFSKFELLMCRLADMAVFIGDGILRVGGKCGTSLTSRNFRFIANSKTSDIWGPGCATTLPIAPFW